MNIDGAKILVTGASSGIGEALAPLLGGNGVRPWAWCAGAPTGSRPCSSGAARSRPSRACGRLISATSPRRAGRARGRRYVRRSRRARQQRGDPEAHARHRSHPGRRRASDDCRLSLPRAHGTRVAPPLRRTRPGPSAVRVEHRRPHPDRERIRILARRSPRCAASRKRWPSTSRGQASRSSWCCPGRSPRRSGSNPTTNRRSSTSRKSHRGVRGRNRRRDRRRRLRVFRTADLPGRCRRQGDRRRQDRELRPVRAGHGRVRQDVRAGKNGRGSQQRRAPSLRDRRGRRGRGIRAVRREARPDHPRAHRSPRRVWRARVGETARRAALDDIRARGLVVVPLCPFVARYVERHPEYDDLVDHEALAALNKK